jgi:hypothetical protein
LEEDENTANGDGLSLIEGWNLLSQWMNLLHWEDGASPYRGLNFQKGEWNCSGGRAAQREDQLH